MIDGVKFEKLGLCEECVLGKQHKEKFGTRMHDTKDILDYIYIYVWGPTLIPSCGGVMNFVYFIDNFSNKLWVYFLKKIFPTYLRTSKFGMQWWKNSQDDI